MRAYGWTESHLTLAAARCSQILNNEFKLRDVQILAENCRKGNQTIQFVLRPNGARRGKDGIYPPGVKVRDNGERQRGVAAPCWHAFGHFMQAAFDIAPLGMFRTARAIYDTVDGFRWRAPRAGQVNIGSMFCPQRYQDACDCAYHGTEKFLT